MRQKSFKKGKSKFKFIYFALFASIFAFAVFTLSFKTYALLQKRNVCANSITCIKDLSASVDNSETGMFAGQVITPPAINLAQDTFSAQVLGTETPTGPKRVEVDLTNQKLIAYEGDVVVMEAPVATGKWYPTPTGEFTVWIKVRAQKMSGGSGASYYYLPNVPYVMFFYNDEVVKGRGFSLHGAYWHNNFGHAMSHGCVNMRIDDAQKLYNWIGPTAEGNVTHSDEENPGTKVIIYGKAL